MATSRGWIPSASLMLPMLLLAALLTATPPGRQSTAAASEVMLPFGNTDAPAPKLGEELVDLRTETSRTFTTDQGNLAAFLYPGAVNYREPDTGWRPIDTSLVPSSEPGFAFEPAATPYRLLVPSTIGQDPVRFAVASEEIAMTLEGAAGAPIAKGNTATITNALSSADVQYVAGTTGIKENLILNAPPGAGETTYTWSVALSAGLTIARAAGGALEFGKASGRGVAIMPSPFMYDADGSEAPLSYDLSTAGGKPTISISPSANWLNDPARAYPVVIDPTLTMSPSLDCRIASGGSANTNFCAVDTLKAGTPGNILNRSLLNFNVSSIPARSTVLSADLGMYVSDTTTQNGAQYNVHQVTNTWTSGVTWNKRNGTNSWGSPGGDFAAAVVDGVSISTSGVSKHWFIGDLVQKWVDGGQTNQGLIVKQATEAVDNVITFPSVEFAMPDQRPSLVVVYSERTGDLENYTFEERTLNDRMGLKVQVASGNLLLRAQDLQIKGTKLDLDLTRYYNSLSTDQTHLGPGWVMNTGTDIRIDDVAGPDVAFYGPSGYRVVFKGDGQGNYTSPRAVDATLTKLQTDEWRLRWFSEEKWIFHPTDGGATSGKLKSIVDQNGNDITMTYTGGELSTITDTQDRTVTFSYVGGKIDFITDTAGNRVFDYTYAGGFLTGYTDPVNGAAKPTAYTYTGGLLTKITDPRGNDTVITYDAQRRAKTITRVTQSSTDVDPIFTLNYFPGNTCSGTADVKGKTDVIDENGNTTSYCYDRHDQIQKVIDAAGKSTSKTYTSHGNVAELTESGVSSPFAFTYSNDNLTQLSLPGGGNAQVGYDESTFPHFPTSVRDFANDKAGTATWEYTYGTNNETGTYGNLKTAKNTSLAITFTYDYNANGTLDSITDGRGNLTDLTYDAQGNLTQVDPSGTHGTMTFTYDCVSRVRTVTDQRGNRQTITYDALDRVELIEFETNPTAPSATCTTPASTQPLSRVDYGYDPNGNLASRFDDVTGTTNFTYDELNRMTKESPQAPVPVTDYTYWPNGNLKTVSDDTGTVSYTYFAVNTLQRVTDQQGETTEFTYDDRYLRTRTTYRANTSSKIIMDANWDNARRLTNVRSYKGNVNNCTATNRAGCLTWFDYTYTAPNGNKTLSRYTMMNTSGQLTNYRYDDVGRLTKACPTIPCGSGPSNFEYGYDKNGNLDTKTIGGTTTSLSYNAANELTSAGGTTYGYDNAGNLTSSSQGFAATYNEKNHMTSVTPPGGQPLGMAYEDATQDRRVTVGTERLAYNQLGLSGQGPNNGNPHATYWVRDNDGMLLLERDAATSTRYYYALDGQGSVAAMISPNGTAATTYKYEPYGAQTVLSGTTFNPWGYAGGYQDAGTGLVKFGTRYYAPDLSRWTQRDPVFGQLNSPMSLNPYGYVMGDPINRVDLGGRCVEVGDLLLALWETLDAATFFGFGLWGISLLGPSLGFSATLVVAGFGAAIGTGIEAWEHYELAFEDC